MKEVSGAHGLLIVVFSTNIIGNLIIYQCKKCVSFGKTKIRPDFKKDRHEYKIKQFLKCFVNSKNKSNFAAQKISSK